MGPFSTESLATTGTGRLREPQGPVYQMVWFIVVVTVVLLLLIVGIVILTLIIKYKITHRPHVPSAGKYHGKKKMTLYIEFLVTNLNLIFCLMAQIIDRGSISISYHQLFINLLSLL